MLLTPSQGGSNITRVVLFLSPTISAICLFAFQEVCVRLSSYTHAHMNSYISQAIGIRRTLTSKKKKQVEEDAADGWLAWAANKQTMNQ
jgi:hypothetical protein